ncbi:hypothetical protein ASPACDRAFT_55439 [Aspergillus aculeatus ATCC 16872]|uniref:Uncharacterized protein n=1 Tax=Aspergillus aculeatus (strain ATCC 16872 / CBS 172.66 / WB 5094) TaxID=690307 RepID=A0A1L9WG19_ASPA1|nr:uncharacterized protein ASPACDRAFT_55439 [Aspergillus aculeatus ATCC 16872]OJJ95119.1 hypothetical protein ASPACDRAFT_55439 [Aspergillus aculeatus ATCC 16872]
MGLTILIGLVALAATAAWVIFTYFLSPLASIPNAGILAPVSRLLWEFPTEYQGKITLELPRLHRKLGPLVRIGPNQISFYSLDIYKIVHAPNSPFAKDPRVYNQFVQDGHPALFSITDTKEHAQRRRHMGILFNRSKVPALTEMMLEQIDKWIKCLGLAKSKGPIDLGPSCRALESDIVSTFAFGNAIGGIDSLQSGDELAVIKENDLKSSKMPVVSHIIYALSLNQSFQAEVIADLDASGWPTDMSALEAIPRLVACVKEGIRWTGAAAAMLPRIVPRGGYSLAGKHLPGGTMISSSPIWYLRDETAFPDPERYRPSRWLVQEKTDTTSRRDDYYIPFSKGASTCIGNHFASLELYLSVSRLLKRYFIHPADLSGANASDHEAVLPPRREWVAAVPMNRLEVVLRERS